MPCDSTIVKSMNVYLPALDDEEISPIPFVRACNETGRFLGVFGRGLHPVKYLITANTQMLYGKLKKHSTRTDKDLRLLLQELSNEDETVCEITQRLLRCLLFAQEVMEYLADPQSENEMKNYVLEVYNRQLEPIQSPMIVRLVNLCARVCPGKDFVLSKLKEKHETEEDIRTQILKAATKISKTVGDIKILSDQWAFTETYFA